MKNKRHLPHKLAPLKERRNKHQYVKNLQASINKKVLHKMEESARMEANNTTV